MPFKCIIAEDEPIGREILQGYIGKDRRLSLEGSYKTALEALSHIKDKKADLIFLDIHLPDISGIELLRSLSSSPLVIFTTAFREYALDAFDLNAVDYLLKPFSFERFLQAVNKAIDLFPETFGPFFLRDGAKLIQVQIEDILYIEALREYARIVTINRPFLVHQSMKSLEEKLPAAQFVRIHKSYIVAVSRISAIEGGEVIIGKDRLPISRQDRAEVLEKITKNRFI